MEIKCGCIYDTEGNVIELCELHAEILRFKLMVDNMWDVLRNGTMTPHDRLFEVMEVLKEGYNAKGD